jgi:hypothetical protein
MQHRFQTALSISKETRRCMLSNNNWIFTECMLLESVVVGLYGWLSKCLEASRHKLFNHQAYPVCNMRVYRSQSLLEAFLFSLPQPVLRIHEHSLWLHAVLGFLAVALWYAAGLCYFPMHSGTTCFFGNQSISLLHAYEICIFRRQAAPAAPGITITMHFCLPIRILK